MPYPSLSADSAIAGQVFSRKSSWASLGEQLTGPIVGINCTPGTWTGTAGTAIAQFGLGAIAYTPDFGAFVQLYNSRWDGTNYRALTAGGGGNFATSAVGTIFASLSSAAAGAVQTWTQTAQINEVGVGSFVGLTCFSRIATSNLSVPANYGVIIPGPYDAATFVIDLGSGAVMEVT